MDNTDNNFATKLNRLFDEKTKPDGTRYSQKEVLESAPVLTRVYLWRLRNGKVLRPSYAVVKALADFFGVDPGYFFENNQMKVTFVEDGRQKDLSQQIALRSAGLDQDGQKAVLLMIEAIKKSKK